MENKIKHFYYSYIYFLIKYFSFKKLFNLLYNFWEYKAKKINLNSVPSVVHIDVSSACILNCPLCPTGKSDKRQKKLSMGFNDFKDIFDLVKDYVFFIWLYNWGEPFLCKDIFKIVEYCHQNNVGVKVDSNLNFYNEGILKNIVSSKIDYISFSIDGLTQKVYQFYRRKGDIQKVFLGLNKIMEYKKKFKSRYPITVWQYLLNNQNLKEVEEARKYSKNVGIDVFEAHPLSLYTEVDSKYNEKNFQKFLSKTGVNKKSAKNGKSSRNCRYLWCSLVFNPGRVFAPCPVIYRDSDMFGYLSEGNLKLSEIINSSVYKESRKLFKFKNYKTEVFTPCTRCEWFTKPTK